MKTFDFRTAMNWWQERRREKPSQRKSGKRLNHKSGQCAAFIFSYYNPNGMFNFNHSEFYTTLKLFLNNFSTEGIFGLTLIFCGAFKFGDFFIYLGVFVGCFLCTIVAVKLLSEIWINIRQEIRTQRLFDAEQKRGRNKNGKNENQ